MSSEQLTNFCLGVGVAEKKELYAEDHRIWFFSRLFPRGDGDVHPWADSAHPQACHMRLGAKSHDGSLIQDKALGAGRHYGPCSRSLGSMSSGCLLTRRSGTPPREKSSTELPLTSPQPHTYSGFTVAWLDWEPSEQLQQRCAVNPKPRRCQINSNRDVRLSLRDTFGKDFWSLDTPASPHQSLRGWTNYPLQTNLMCKKACQKNWEE